MRADPFFTEDLSERLVEDWYDGLIYTEADMQASAYYWLRRYFQRDRSLDWIIRLQPSLSTPNGLRKPDIVIYKAARPFDFVELKCQLTDGFDDGRVKLDLHKLRDLRDVYNVRHAYAIVLYDDKHNWSFRRQDWMKNYLTFVSANVRLHDESCRQRRGYHGARHRWEKWCEARPASNGMRLTER